MASSRRGRFIAVVLFVAVVAVCISLWLTEGPVWRWVMLKQVELNILKDLRGYTDSSIRYSGDAPYCLHSLEWLDSTEVARELSFFVSRKRFQEYVDPESESLITGLPWPIPVTYSFSVFR